MSRENNAPLGEFAVYVDEEQVFSRLEQRSLPYPTDIVMQIQSRLFGTCHTYNGVKAWI